MVLCCLGWLVLARMARVIMKMRELVRLRMMRRQLAPLRLVHHRPSRRLQQMLARMVMWLRMMRLQLARLQLGQVQVTQPWV